MVSGWSIILFILREVVSFVIFGMFLLFMFGMKMVFIIEWMDLFELMILRVLIIVLKVFVFVILRCFFLFVVLRFIMIRLKLSFVYSFLVRRELLVWRFNFVFGNFLWSILLILIMCGFISGFLYWEMVIV